MPQAPDLATARFGAVLNTSSGGCDAAAEHIVEACLAQAGLRPHRIWCGGGADVDRALEEATSEAVDVLIVVGGDGTIRAAAERCSTDGPLLMPLPGGTMNKLPKRFYGDRSWREALRDTLAAPVVQPVHGGEVDGKRFFVAAIFGEPTRFAQAREAARDGDLTGAVGKGVEALRKALSAEISYEFVDGRKQSAEAVAVLCPLTSAALSDEEEVLEAAAIDLDGPLDALRLAWTAAFKNWREDETVARAKLARLPLSSSQAISGLLDGESFTFAPQVTVRLVRNAFKALRPAA